ncbi:uncharacterized protein LOC115457737 [Microcaecilia unicolor]|uniref:Uncharacterized protein LOC115457737 n=1 Tax=Microcaecilia unicolor TaxID=1415580 RepID=A0A6P7WS00_9AMPH|nr:uncharacterized protein LOC115457737 [Microcaecilia unicolor]
MAPSALLLLPFFAMIVFLSAPAQGHVRCHLATFDVWVQQGDTALFPCFFSQSSVTPRDKKVIWQRVRQGAEDEVVFFKNGEDRADRQNEAFVTRASVGDRWYEEKNASLTLRHILPKDAGLYRCLLLTFPLGPRSPHHCAVVRLDVDTQQIKTVKDPSEHMPTGSVIWGMLLASVIFLIVWGFLLLITYLIIVHPKALQKSSPDIFR